MAVWTANEGHLEVLNAIGSAFVEANPDIVSAVTYESITAPDYIAALTTQIAGGDSPDLVWVFERNGPEFVQQGVFANVTDVLQSTEGYDFDDILIDTLAPWSQGSDVFAYPFSNSPYGIFVNSALLEQAGQPNPRDLIASGDWTWDAATEIAASVSQTADVGGLFVGDPYVAWNDVLPVLWESWGANGWSADGTTCEFTSPEMVSFLEWFHTQVFEADAIPRPGEAADFAAGQAALALGQMSWTRAFGEDLEWDFVPLPAGPAGVAPVVGQAGVGVVARGDNPEVAAQFLAFFTSPESVSQLAAFFPPARESLLTIEVISEAAPALTNEQIQATVIDQALEGSTKEGHPKMNTIVPLVRSALDSLWVPDGDAASAAQLVCDNIDPVISAL